MEAINFIGRESELNHLDQLLESVLKGEGKTAFIIGDAGSGKSTLVEHFIRRGQSKSDKLLATMTTCDSQTGQSDAYLPFLETLAQLSGDAVPFSSRSVGKTNSNRLKSFVSITTKALLEDVPNLIGSFIPGGSFLFYAARFSAEKAGWLDKFETAQKQARLEGKIEASRIFQLYTELLERLSQHAPLIIVLDDLHWVDEASSQLLFHLSRRISDLPILLIGLYRPNDIALGRGDERHPMQPVINELKRIHGDIIVELGDEEEPELRAFVESLIDAEPNQLDADFREAFFQHTNGHALFSQELLRSFKERGTIVRNDNGEWYLDGPLEWQQLPPRMEGVIEERINRLDESLRDILSVASVQGVQFLAQVVSRIVEVSGSRIIRMLSRELQGRHGLVIEDEISSIGGKRVSHYRFSHVLFQQYLYHDLSQGERMALHADVGDMMEELYAQGTHEVTNELAYHFAEADEWEKALPYYLAAANRALGVGSYNMAFEFLETALENADKLPPEKASHAKLEILLTMGSIHQALKGFTNPDVEEAFTHSRELAEKLQDDFAEAVAIYGLWTLHLFRLDLEQARELAGVITNMGESRNDALLKVIGYRALANTHYQEGSLTETIEDADRVLEHYETDNVGKYLRHLTYDPKVFALGLRAWAESLQGNDEQARTSNAEMFEYARELNHPVSTCVAHLCALKLEYNFEDAAAIQRHADDIRALAREYGFPWYDAFGELFDVWLSAMQHPSSEGDDDYAASLERIYSAGVAPDQNLLIHSQFCRMITVALVETGRNDDALAWADKGIEVAEAHGETIYLAEIIRIRGTILLAKGEFDNAIAELQRSVEVAQSNGHRLFELRAQESLGRALEQQARPV